MNGYATPDSEAQALIWRIQDETGLSDGGLARACGVGRVTIWRVRMGEQSGERILPRLAQLWRIHDPDYEVAHLRFHSLADAPPARPNHNAARTRQRASSRQTRADMQTYTQLVKSLADSMYARATQAPPATPTRPTVGRLTLTPAGKVNSSPYMICTMCSATVPTKQGYTVVWNHAQVYLCSRTCADRLANQR